jgi:starch-binding outer membrane protein, SusD/RagB family
MKFNSFKKGIFFAAVLAMPLTACDDLLTTEPRTALSPEVALANVSGTEAILVSVYNRLLAQGAYGNSLFIIPDIMGDVFVQRPGASRGNAPYNMTPGGTLGYYPYASVNEANYIIDGIGTLDAPQATKDRLLGSALFLRALNYFNAVRTYGYEPNKAVNGWDRGVIMRDKPTKGLTDADFRARGTVTEAYQLIESDLQQAATLLAGNTNVYYASPAAANALLARVYLYWERWADAEARATAAIGATAARLTTTAAAYELAWSTSPNPESVFELNVNANTESVGVNESMASWVTPRQWGDFGINPELVALFPAGDIRLSLLKTGTVSGIQLQYLDKWNANKGNFAQNLPVIRLAELHLIRAEARAEQNNIAGGLAELNALRAARGVPAATAANRQALVDAILLERRLELAYEGHRFYDQKRRGMNIQRPSAIGANATLPYTDFKILAQWPTAQVNLNPLLQQNPGY